MVGLSQATSTATVRTRNFRHAHTLKLMVHFSLAILPATLQDHNSSGNLAVFKSSFASPVEWNRLAKLNDAACCRDGPDCAANLKVTGYSQNRVSNEGKASRVSISSSLQGRCQYWHAALCVKGGKCPQSRDAVHGLMYQHVQRYVYKHYEAELSAVDDGSLELNIDPACCLPACCLLPY